MYTYVKYVRTSRELVYCDESFNLTRHTTDFHI